jgi:hypothetical protein
MNYKPFPCPKCGRLLQPAGEITFAGQTLPTYQCDECLVTKKIFGEPVEMALTFCIGADGKPFDPAEDEED